MFEFHKNRKHYYTIQIDNAKGYILPFIEKSLPITPGMRVLEIGCGEGGVLKAFIDKGCIGVGVEFDATRIRNAEEWMADDISAGRLRFITKDIYETDPEKELGGAFDIIILKDVIEHIHDQPRLIAWMKTFLRPGGVIFFGFPPWQMPFGGHQQICRNKWLSKLPYYHLLPRSVYKALLKRFNENVDEMVEIYDTRISIERFERISRETGYEIAGRLHYFINPIYQWKFGWKPRVQNSFISRIPWFRNFVTTCVFYLLKEKKA